MFNDKAESFKIAIAHDSKIKDVFNMEDTDSISYHAAIMNYSGNRYSTYVDMFDTEQMGNISQQELVDHLNENYS